MYRYMILYLQFIAIVDKFRLLSCNYVNEKEKGNSQLLDSSVDLKANSLCSTSPIAEDGKRKRIVLFGDSITQHGFDPTNNGWGNSLNNWWTRRVDLINRGFAGYNSKHCLMIVEKAVIAEKPDMVIVCIGANDALDSSLTRQFVSLDQFIRNLKQIVLELKSRLKSVQVVLITPPPIWEKSLMDRNRMKGKSLFLDRTNTRTLLYVNACKDVGHEIGVPVIDLWTECEGYSENRAQYLSDGLHLSAKGNDRLFTSVKNMIWVHFSGLAPENLPMHMPEWSQLEEGFNTTCK